MIMKDLEKKSRQEYLIDHAKRSWTAIRDGQLSTGLIALVLFTMGTNMFKGF